MNWPALLRWAAEHGWTPQQLLAMTPYQVLILLGGIGPDEPTVTLSPEEAARWRSLRNSRSSFGPLG